MKIDLLYALTNRTGEMSWNGVLQAARQHAQLADELGFDRVWLGEHHFDVDGTDASPNPILLAADLAARTTNIRFGMAAVSITLWHPIRVAEDLAMLDHFADGRLDVAFGRGILPIEVKNLNPEADRWGGADSSIEIFDEKYDIVQKLWTEEVFSYQGKRYTLPTPDTKYIHAPGAPEPEGWLDDEGNLVAFAMYPKCYQDPYPPLFAVTESERGFRDAAHKGIGAITWYPTGKVLTGLNEAYQESYREAHGETLPLGVNTSVLRMAFVADTDEEARAATESSIADFFRFVCAVRDISVWLDADEDPSSVDWQGFSDAEAYDFLYERDHLFIGSPATVREQMLRMTASHHVQNWLLQFGVPGIDSNEAISRAMRLFAEHIMPALHEAGAQLPASAIH
ncbi:LLM class flavin-dependent oxidoreductase [Nocardioides kongjuensis]|uniref:Alkanesulfonate monooxygenase SsuD/methylene tetrahydromethanopterin reductase-like flavin-dependent oxidoreductase (Luciferase family) n=1 Tax=Nocardioides kongjuensis TaxID=349522 RepID=A0A852RIK8_9ACTN|nr:LLM class flavin-dependent oxidoreductase [Nocardioides kongjuensis]NYD33341.1 alkanesulfonate monooxygenase SsuD/methylene tetrahydromethanopterin reductase-like flavin-dependent oxidoreductase (luciferase family) [Nocardioides kongjuensis]